MHSQCNDEGFGFHAIGRRVLVGDCDGDKISSDGRSLLLREVEQRTDKLQRLAQRFEHHRDAELIEHSVEELVKQRVMVSIGL